MVGRGARRARRRPRQCCCTPTTVLAGCVLVLLLMWCAFVQTLPLRGTLPRALPRKVDVAARPLPAVPVLRPRRAVPVARKRSAAVLPRARVEMFARANCAGAMQHFDQAHVETKCVRCFDTCRAKFPDESPMLNKIRSVRVVLEGAGVVDSRGGWSVVGNSLCSGAYSYSEEAQEKHTVLRDVRPESGCVNVEGEELPNTLSFYGLPHPDDNYVAQSYHVAYSAESSGYFGYQAYAHLHAFQTTGQQTTPRTGYTRLLTAHEDDDLATSRGGAIPTFAFPRDPYSHQYSPFNKPHIVAGWMADVTSGPKEEVIVLIDPDNWLTATLAPIAAKVRVGSAVAAPAFFDRNPLVTELFRAHICSKSCDVVPDTVAVPYFVHREDLKRIAPLWVTLTKKVRALFQQPALAKKYSSLQPGWCSEMYAYIFAAAELRIKHTVVPALQIRDVDGKITVKEAQRKRVRMIHMGRAWFPAQYAHSPAASRWVHTEGKSLRPPRTEQVWCKCNDSAGDERPWPLPEGIDFVSNVTLTLLHESLVKYGNPPRNKYRKSYHANYD